MSFNPPISIQCIQVTASDYAIKLVQLYSCSVPWQPVQQSLSITCPIAEGKLVSDDDHHGVVSANATGILALNDTLVSQNCLRTFLSWPMLRHSPTASLCGAARTRELLDSAHCWLYGQLQPRTRIGPSVMGVKRC